MRIHRLDCGGHKTIESLQGVTGALLKKKPTRSLWLVISYWHSLHPRHRLSNPLPHRVAETRGWLRRQFPLELIKCCSLFHIKHQTNARRHSFCSSRRCCKSCIQFYLQRLRGSGKINNTFAYQVCSTQKLLELASIRGVRQRCQCFMRSGSWLTPVPVMILPHHFTSGS